MPNSRNTFVQTGQHPSTSGTISIHGGYINLSAADGYIILGSGTWDTKTITKQIKPWKKLICFFLGHKNLKCEQQHSLEIWVSTNRKYTKNFMTCERCGIYFQDSVTSDIPLTETEQIIKDIIV